MGAHASMRFIDNNQSWAATGKTLTSAVGLDVIKTDDSECVCVEQCLGRWQTSFQSSGGGSSYGNSIQVKFNKEFICPLLNQVRRAKYGEMVDLTSVNKLAKNESRFNRFTDTDIIGY
jgi:hypothetical protein